MQPDLTTGGRIDVRLDDRDGPTVGAFTIEQPPETMTGFQVHTIGIAPTNGIHDLVLVFVNSENPETSDPVCGVDWIYFHHNDGE